MSSISNMPISEEVAIDGKPGYVWDVYQESVVMSTYLLAFVVSEFDYRVSDPTANGKQAYIINMPSLLVYFFTLSHFTGFQTTFGRDHFKIFLCFFYFHQYS